VNESNNYSSLRRRHAPFREEGGFQEIYIAWMTRLSCLFLADSIEGISNIGFCATDASKGSEVPDDAFVA